MKKSVLIFDKFLGYQVGGAQLSIHRLLEALDVPKEYLGCDVRQAFNAPKFAISSMKVERFPIREFRRFPYIEYGLNRGRIKRELRKRDNPVLLTQGLTGAPAVLGFKGKTVLFIRTETEMNRLGIYQTGLARLLKYGYLAIQAPWLWQIFRDNRRAITKADVIVANSEFVAHEIRKRFHRDAVIVHPLIPVKKLMSEAMPPAKDRPYYTCIGSEIMKGRAIVESLARVLPEKQFMIVGREFHDEKQINNVRYEPWSMQVLDIYRQTRVLLVPSLCAETFGRVAIEARALGIPVLGSDLGGIPESVPAEYIIHDVRNIEHWKEKIEGIESAYPGAVTTARKGIEAFDEEHQIVRFKSCVTPFFDGLL